MELNKSIHITVCLCFYLLLSVEATFFSNSKEQKPKNKHKYFLITSNSPAPSPTSETSTAIKFPNFPETPTDFDPKLKGICAVTENPKLCISLIAPYLRGSANANLALKVVIQRLYILVKDASAIALQERSKRSTSMVIKQSFDNSLELYEKALNNVKMALTALHDNDLDMVHTMLGASISNFGYCNEAFRRQGLKRWQMQKVNDFLIEFAGFGIDISKKLDAHN